jgi:dipeptidyl aminopeptidase/acylaminoacyl peptidase
MVRSAFGLKLIGEPRPGEHRHVGVARSRAGPERAATEWCIASMWRRRFVLVALAIGLAMGCASPGSPSGSRGSAPSAGDSATPLATRVVHASFQAVATGAPIELGAIRGRIVTDDFEDVFAMDVDGSHFVRIAASSAGPEFDGTWSPDGKWVAYRDSTRGINEDDEIFIASADGKQHRNLTKHPANDWGPDWSPDGRTIAFNSDRDHGLGLRGYLVKPDGSNLRRIDVDTWIEYPSWSPDGKKLAFMGARGSNYELFVLDLETKNVTQLTDSPGHDSWPSWSPDGSTIAFSSVRDDCGFAAQEAECWRTGDIGEHFDVWTIRPDGTGLRRVTPEFGQFMTWSPDGRYLLISGYELYVVRPDGTGRLEVRSPALPRALGGIPDWR